MATAVRRQADVVKAVVAGAGFGDQLPQFGARTQWYTVILTGFNVVDDACMMYIDELWVLERRKNRNEALLAATGAATAGILAAGAPASVATLAILAQAFGLASAFNTAFSDSYLYTQNAATIKKLVRKTAEAYRTDIARKLAETDATYPIASPGAAYHHIREYLALCLPPTIQAQIEDLVANAKATPENSAADEALTKAKAEAMAAGPASGVAVVSRKSNPTGTTAIRATTAIKVQ